MDNDKQQVTEAIIKTAMQGESFRGTNGAVLFDLSSNDMVYLLTYEFEPIEFRERLEEMLSDDGHVYMYIVHKDNENMHVSKIPRGV